MEGQEPKTDQLKAAALSFDEARDMAPRLMARGEGELGERILELARINLIAKDFCCTSMQLWYRNCCSVNMLIDI